MIQARKFLEALNLEIFLEPVEMDYSSLDWKESVKIVEDYKPLDIQAATINIALLKKIRDRYPGFDINDSWILSRRGKKNKVNPFKPYAYFVEKEPTVSGSIEDTAVIFLTNSECPYRCMMCDLWKNTTDEPVPAGAIPRQIEWALSHLPPARHIKLYNSGSFFDKRAIPEGIHWAKKFVDFAFQTGVECCTVIPVRSGNGAMDYLIREGFFSPPRISSLEKVIEYGLVLKNGRIYSDVWNIEEFADCPECINQRKNRLVEMNLYQKILAPVECTCIKN